MRRAPAAESFLGDPDGIYKVAMGVSGVAFGELARVRDGE